VDKAVSIDGFTYGGMNRLSVLSEDGCGKGVNVAIACARLGLQVACIGILPGERNELITERLKAGGCATEFVPCAGAVRVNMKVTDRSTGIITELNERGPAISGRETERLVETAARWAKKCSHIVLTGSTPPGCPADIYKTMICAIKASAPECRCVLDADGERFAEGLKAIPHIIKPNRYELEQLCGKKLPDIRDIHIEAMKLTQRGIQIVVVSLGGDGAYLTDGREAFFAPALKVEVKNTVGAGDSMIAGLLLGLTQGRPAEEVFRYGVAAASSSLAAEGTGLIDPALFNEYLPKIDVRRVV
jgi:1-phosphofructokinase